MNQDFLADPGRVTESGFVGDFALVLPAPLDLAASTTLRVSMRTGQFRDLLYNQVAPHCMHE
jgi:hypothetical protein